MTEGNSFTNLLKMMSEQGYNKDVSIVIGKVVKPEPLEVNMGNYIIKESDGDMFIAETLKTHTRDIKIDVKGVTGVVSTTNDGGLYASDHNHNLQPFQVTEGVLSILTPLRPGDKVYVIIDDNDFYVLDKVV